MNGDPMPTLINRMKQRRRDTKVKAMLTVLLFQLRTHIQFWKCPPLSEAHTIIAHTHVGRATQLIFGSTPARRKVEPTLFS